MPLLWASKLKIVVALSSTESEHLDASDVLQAVLNLIDIAQEAQGHGIAMSKVTPTSRPGCLKITQE